MEEKIINARWVKYQCRACNGVTIALPNLNIFCTTHEKEKYGKKRGIPCDPIGFVEKDLIENFNQVPEEIWSILKSSNYLDKLISELDKIIVGEEKLKKTTILLLLGGRLVENSSKTSYHILFSALSGAGKDYFISSTLKLLPKHYHYHKTRITEKFLNYLHPEEFEPNFSYDGTIIYGEDVTNGFLNCDTIKTFMSGGSSIGTVEKSRAIEIKIKGSPIFVLSSATAEPNAELLRRVSIATLDTSKEQTEKILQFQTQTAIKGTTEINSDVVNSAYCLRRVIVNIPFAEQLLNLFPKKLIARTSYNRLLDFIKASTALHQYSRETINGELIATLEDAKDGIEAFISLYGKQSISLTHAQKTVYNFLVESKSSFPASEIFRDCGSKVYTQMHQLVECLNSLSQKSLVSIGENFRGNRLLPVYRAEPQELDLSSLSNILNISAISNLSKFPKEVG